jgi:hypothetical protein
MAIILDLFVGKIKKRSMKLIAWADIVAITEKVRWRWLAALSKRYAHVKDHLLHMV